LLSYPEKGCGGNGKTADPIEATYDYFEDGEFRFQKIRYPKGRYRALRQGRPPGDALPRS
jgi:hypothetical protein